MRPFKKQANPGWGGYKSDAQRKVLKMRRQSGAGATVIDEDPVARRGTPIKQRKATLANVNVEGTRGLSRSPALAVAKAIRDALDPMQAPRPVETLAQMSPEKRAEMERLYGRSK